MAELKTQPTELNVEDFLRNIPDENKRADSFKLVQIIQEITNEPPKMWGSSIIGFGSYHYKYDSGREGDFFITGFSPRKQNLAIYIMPGLERYEKMLADLGKYKSGKSCLYLKKLQDVHLEVLKKMITDSVNYMVKKYH